MIRYQLTDTTPEGLSRAKQKMRLGAFTGVKKALIDVQRHIKLNKLQGQVLRHVTGKLAASVRVLPPELGDRPEGFVVAGGGPASYAAVHEFGGRSAYDIVPQTAKALAWPSSGGVGERYRVARAMAFQRAKVNKTYGPAGAAYNLAHVQRMAGKLGVGLAFAKIVHHPAAKERSFMRTGLSERAGEAVRLIDESIRRELG